VIASRSRRPPRLSVALIALLSLVPDARAGTPASPVHDLVLVGVADGGRIVVLATPGVPSDGRRWRFRTLDLEDASQPLRGVALSASGTKLFLQPAGGPGLVVDLTNQHRHNAPLQWVDPAGLAGDGRPGAASHRLPSQAFVSVRDGVATVVDDAGAAAVGGSSWPAALGAVAGDGAVLIVGGDRRVAVCAEPGASASACRTLGLVLQEEPAAIVARTSKATVAAVAPRFLVLSGPEDATRVVDPEAPGHDPAARPRPEAAMVAALLVHGARPEEADVAGWAAALVRESTSALPAAAGPVSGWQAFRVTPDEALYAPVLEYARRETVFPSGFDLLEQMARSRGARHSLGDEAMTLYDRYLRLDIEARQRRCQLYVRTHTLPGTWLIEYWIYYPFDVGGLGSHLHDPEHFFVEVDKLGGAPRRIVGAGHGYVAGNNIYRADQPGALAVALPLFAIVELGKHATAPDIDRDGVFTPGVDENVYEERSKIWGVRDVIGSIDNQLLPYDSTMSAPRRREEYVAPAAAATRYPGDPWLTTRAICALAPAPPLPERDTCGEATEECARRHVTAHPDYRDVRTVLKEWVFPDRFLSATYGWGPRRGFHSVGLVYSTHLDRVPGVGRFLPLPGRIGGEVFYWRQDVTQEDNDSCVRDCTTVEGVGWGIRHEQFLANLFGLFAAIRFYTPPFDDL
jgi:hypothetical protein